MERRLAENCSGAAGKSSRAWACGREKGVGRGVWGACVERVGCGALFVFFGGGRLAWGVGVAGMREAQCTRRGAWAQWGGWRSPGRHTHPLTCIVYKRTDFTWTDTVYLCVYIYIYIYIYTYGHTRTYTNAYICIHI